MAQDNKKNEISEENSDDTPSLDEEESSGRERGKILLGILFIFIVVVIWYLIDLLRGI